MLCGLIARDVLYLRSLLVFAQIGIGVYAWGNGVPVIAAWNLLLVCINTFVSVQIVRERRSVVLPAPLQRLYDKHFSALTPPEFLRWWRQGQRETLDNEPLARAGQQPDWLYFLLDGTVRVSRDGQRVVDLPSGYFVAEMSLLTGRAANADVDASGTIEVVRWPRRDLQELRMRNPILWTKVQSVIGHDLVEKIRLGESRASATA
jgi:CRP-like cAMP-binding protein